MRVKTITITTETAEALEELLLETYNLTLANWRDGAEKMEALTRLSVAYLAIAAAPERRI